MAGVFQLLANQSNALPGQTRKPLYVFYTYINRWQLDVKFQQKVNTNVSDQAGEPQDFLPFHQPTRLSQQLPRKSNFIILPGEWSGFFLPSAETSVKFASWRFQD